MLSGVGVLRSAMPTVGPPMAHAVKESNRHPDRAPVPTLCSIIHGRNGDPLRPNEIRKLEALVERLRRRRYWRWTQERAVVDVLEINYPKPMTKWEIAGEMEKGGYEFGALTFEPQRSVGVVLSKLSNRGKVRKVTDGHGGEYPVDATWTVSDGKKE